MNIIYLGRYNKDGILTGPEKVARRVFDNITKIEKSIFIEYFFDGKIYGLFKKLLGKEKIDNVNDCEVTRLGLITLFFKLVKLKPKVIHIITFERFAFVSFIYKLFFRVKIIYNIHGLVVYENEYFGKQSEFNNLKDKITEKTYVKYADIILLLSDNFKTILEKYYKVDNDKIRYIKNGVDSEYHLAQERKEFSNTKTLKIVFIADIKRKEKGFNFLKKSLEMISFKIDLYVVDNKENEISFENKMINVFCVDKMHTAELAGFLKDKDIFISASFYEPFSIMSVECMATGVIPLLTKETGASELIENGVNGFIFDYDNDKKLISILNELNNNPELRKNISKEAKKIYDIISWENITNDYLNIYKSLE